MRTISMSFVMRWKKGTFCSSGRSCWSQSYSCCEHLSIACDAWLIARCTSSSEGESATEGTESCTSISKKGRSTKRKLMEPRLPTRFLIRLSEFFVQLSSARYM